MDRSLIKNELDNIKNSLSELASKFDSSLPETGSDENKERNVIKQDESLTGNVSLLKEYNILYIDKKFVEFKDELKDQIHQIKDDTTEKFNEMQNSISRNKPNYFKIFLIYFIPIIIGILAVVYIFYGPYLEKRLDLFKTEFSIELKEFMKINYYRLRK